MNLDVNMIFGNRLVRSFKTDIDLCNDEFNLLRDDNSEDLEEILKQEISIKIEEYISKLSIKSLVKAREYEKNNDDDLMDWNYSRGV